MSEKRTLISGGAILTMDAGLGDFDRGDVLIEGRRIAAVEPTIEVDADEVIDARAMLVTPGFIDTHIHLWQAPLRGLAAESYGGEYFPTIHPLSARYRPEDMYASTYAGAIDLLAHGVTTVFDFCHSVNSPEHADASVAALREAGIRALFGYSFRDRPEVERRSFHGHDERIKDAQRVRGELLTSDDDLVRMAIALNNIEHVDAETNARELACARELGVMATVHSATPWQVALVHERGLLGPDLQWVHVCEISDQELRYLADQGGTIAATPEGEINSGLMPILARGRDANVQVTLGSDVPSAVNGDPFFYLRLAFHIERFREGQIARLEGRAPIRTESTPALTARDVLGFGTSGAADALGLGSVTGTLTPGKDADIVMLSTAQRGLSSGDPAGHVVLQADAADVDSVIVAGRIRKRSGRLIDVDEARMRSQLDAARDQVVPRRR